MSRNGLKKTWRGNQTEDYAYIGIEPNKIEPWEDGHRTRGKRGEYEWWYFDVVGENNTSLVLIFYTVDAFKSNGGYTPYVTLEYQDEQGVITETEYRSVGSDYTFSTDSCYVKIGPNTLEGNLDKYTIHFENDLYTLDFELESQVPTWRSETGHCFFNGGKRDYFAWLPAIPRGSAKATLKTPTQTIQMNGEGYHDHNWGNKLVLRLLHHWYWGRANIGDYTVISSYMTTHKRFDHKQYMSFVLAKGDTIIGSHFTHQVSFNPQEGYRDEKTGKPSYRKIEYEIEIDSERYVITYYNDETVVAFYMRDKMQGLLKMMAGLIGFKGSYARYAGKVTLEKYQGNQRVEVVESHALWEQMYFGKPLKNIEYGLGDRNN